MHMPKSAGKKYIVQGQCSISTWPEARALASENSTALGDWIFQDLICCWGALHEIITDNGQPFIKALAYLSKRYHINHIRISGYNHHANGIVEQSHFDFCQALFKSVDGDQSKWMTGFYSVLWAERVSPRRRLGCSPYFIATGNKPLLPLDIVEATYLQPPPDSILSTTDLIARHAIALQKHPEDLARVRSHVYAARRKAALR